VTGLLDGKVAVVAGGGRGMGEATSTLFASSGAAVVVVDKSRERAQRVAVAIEAAGRPAVALHVDLRDSDAPQRVVAETIAAFGSLDIVVNVAGGMRAANAWRPIRLNDAEDWDFVFRQNVGWIQQLAVAAAAQMMAQGTGGSVISIGSVSGLFGAPNHAAYGAAKAALIHLTKSLALEYGRHGVRFNVVCPGSVRTPAVEAVLTPEEKRRDEVTTPLQRAGTPEDIAKAILFFASDLAAFVTGQTLVVDGGATVRFPLLSPGADPSESIV
jgi:NAD(P)-dependent dehydrogenase (short-subunit alcohol dehydrogenase family)